MAATDKPSTHDTTHVPSTSHVPSSSLGVTIPGVTTHKSADGTHNVVDVPHTDSPAHHPDVTTHHATGLENLELKKSVDVYGVATFTDVHGIVVKTAREKLSLDKQRDALRHILKNGGMDSQQIDHAMLQITGVIWGD